MKQHQRLPALLVIPSEGRDLPKQADVPIKSTDVLVKDNPLNGTGIRLGRFLVDYVDVGMTILFGYPGGRRDYEKNLFIIPN